MWFILLETTAESPSGLIYQVTKTFRVELDLGETKISQRKGPVYKNVVLRVIAARGQGSCVLMVLRWINRGSIECTIYIYKFNNAVL